VVPGECSEPHGVGQDFHPLPDWTWYGIEYDEEGMFFGWISGFEDELAYFSLKGMEGVEVMLGVERDLHSKGHHPRHAMISPCRSPLTQGFRNLRSREGGTAY